MHGTFESGSDRHSNLEQLAVFFIERSPVMNRGAKAIISLPNFRISSFEILVSLWKLRHKERLLLVLKVMSSSLVYFTHAVNSSVFSLARSSFR